MNEFNMVSSNELNQIEGGGWFSSLVNDIEGAAKGVGNAIENAAKDVGNALENRASLVVGGVCQIVKGVIALF